MSTAATIRMPNAVFELPLAANPQEFEIDLSDVPYIMRITWCWPAQCWIMDLYDETMAPILLGNPLVTGTNLLEQYEQLGVPGIFVVFTDHDSLEMPTFTNLGQLSHLYYVPFNQNETLG